MEVNNEERLADLTKRYFAAKKTADEMKAELNFAAVLVFCGASCVWSLYQILCDLASSINGHILGAKRSTEKELSK